MNRVTRTAMVIPVELALLAVFTLCVVPVAIAALAMALVEGLSGWARWGKRS
jgi:hypothetical protein